MKRIPASLRARQPLIGLPRNPVLGYAIAILATSRPELRQKLQDYRKKQAEKILAEKLPE